MENSYSLITLKFVEKLLMISGTDALTSSIDMLEKKPWPRSFCPISNVYNAFSKYSAILTKLARRAANYYR